MLSQYSIFLAFQIHDRLRYGKSALDFEIQRFLFKVKGIWAIIDCPQHDEVEPNLKKILHTNGIWGLEANSM